MAADHASTPSAPDATEEAALRAEMRREADSSVMGIGLGGPQTAEMAKGRAIGIPVFVVLGWVFAIPLALLLLGAQPTMTRVLIGALVGGMFGLATGLVAGGRLNPSYNKEGNRLPGEQAH